MKNYFSISKTAEILGITAETLRHYDRIGLVAPCKIDEWTGYRYYSQQEIVKLNTVKALRCMGLTLAEIKRILSYDDFGKIVGALKGAEAGAEQKIAELNYAKEKIGRARAFYESKISGEKTTADFILKEYPERVILLSATMEEPTLDNLWDYHSRFYSQIPEKLKNDFSFEDLAGIYGQGGESRLFAVCTRFKQTDGIKILPRGKYLCADCTEENRKRVTESLIERAKKGYNVAPEFTVQLIVLSGILQWNYQAQVFITR